MGGGAVRTARAPLAWLVAAAAVLAVSAGCASGGDPQAQLPPAQAPLSAPGSAPPTAGTSPSPTSTFMSTGDPAHDGYVLFWKSFLDAQAYGAPDFPELGRRASGQALDWARTTISAYVTNGWVRRIKPGFGINSEVASRTDTTARVTDVQDWALWPLVVRGTDQVVAGSTPRQCITADLVPRGDTWVVTMIGFRQSGC